MSEDPMTLDKARKIAASVAHRPDGTSQALAVLDAALRSCQKELAALSAFAALSFMELGSDDLAHRASQDWMMEGVR